MPRAVALLVSFAVVLSACSGDGTSTSPTSSGSSPNASTESDPKTEDARFLLEQMQELHPDLFHSVAKEDFLAAADGLLENAAGLTEEEFLVEAMRMSALPSLEGRDGHGGMLIMHSGIDLGAFPLHLFEFEDGLFVVDAFGEHRDLIGREITHIGGRPVEEVRHLLEPLVSRDNPTTVKARLPTLFVTSEVLQGIGVTDGSEARFTFDRRVKRTIEPIPMESYVEKVGHRHLWGLPADDRVLYLSKVNESSWATFLEERKTLFVQYNETQQTAGLQTRIEHLLRKRPERIVLDLRHNLGGDNTTYHGLVSLLSTARIDKPGRLFVIPGRTTFSAAGNLAGVLDHETQATFVGEPPGGAPNQFGDQQPIVLPNSGIQVFVPVYFVEAVEGDDRISIPPDIPVPTRSRDFFRHIDPQLEAILALPPAS